MISLVVVALCAASVTGAPAEPEPAPAAAPSSAAELAVPPPPLPPTDGAVTPPPGVPSEGARLDPSLPYGSEQSEAWARRDADAPRRYLIEGLGGLAGVAIGSWGAIALLSSVCSTPAGGGCFPAPVMALPGIFVMPLGIWLAGRAMNSPGGYWWAVLGSLPGWVVAELTFYYVDKAAQGRFNPVSYAPFVLPILPALFVFEWSATRELRSEEEDRAGISKLMILPSGPRGSWGMSLAFAF